MRFNEFPGLESQIYTVGNEQEYHFKVLFNILEKLDIADASKNYHFAYGYVYNEEGIKIEDLENHIQTQGSLKGFWGPTKNEETQENAKSWRKW
mgnify:CR=1 FL=1